MAIVSHAHKFIFLKTRKTAGSSIEIWLAPKLDSERDLAALTGDLEKHHPNLASRFHSGDLKAHSTAKQIKKIVGPDIWNSYYKFTVERNPWDRILSFWKWRQEKYGLHASLDAFLDAIEDGTPDSLRAVRARYWSNWPIYTIRDQVVADRVIQYSNLQHGLADVLSEVGIEFDGLLPHAKAGLRSTQDRVDNLTDAQIERISRIYQKEIATFDYRIEAYK